MRQWGQGRRLEHLDAGLAVDDHTGRARGVCRGPSLAVARIAATWDPRRSADQHSRHALEPHRHHERTAVAPRVRRDALRGSARKRCRLRSVISTTADGSSYGALVVTVMRLLCLRRKQTYTWRAYAVNRRLPSTCATCTTALDRDRRRRSALLDDEGLSALTMRRLGGELGVEGMALYRHFPNKDALVDAVAAHLLDLVELARSRDRHVASGRARCRQFIPRRGPGSSHRVPVVRHDGGRSTPGCSTSASASCGCSSVVASPASPGYGPITA